MVAAAEGVNVLRRFEKVRWYTYLTRNELRLTRSSSLFFQLTSDASCLFGMNNFLLKTENVIGL